MQVVLHMSNGTLRRYTGNITLEQQEVGYISFKWRSYGKQQRIVHSGNYTIYWEPKKREQA